MTAAPSASPSASSGPAPSLPLAGLTVVEVALGVSDLGLGLAGGAPGMILSGLGARVVRVVDPVSAPIDASVTWGDAWHRDKEVVALDDPTAILELLCDADVAIAYGPESAIEQQGLGFADVARANPTLVYARCRPSRTAGGEIDDYGLLVEARSGFCTQLAGHRPGPIFADVRATGSGTAFILTSSVLALLLRRAQVGIGGWSETSLYDGMLATLGCMLGRSEHAPEPVESYWASGNTYPNFLYRCADGELLQVWFGGKGMYAKLIEVLGDEPSAEGYYADQVNGGLQARKERWHGFFDRKPRDEWIAELRAAGVACEPILEPAEALTDPHLAEVGLAVARRTGDRVDTFVGAPIAVTPVPGPGGSGGAPEGAANPTGSRTTARTEDVDAARGPDGPGGPGEGATNPTGSQTNAAAAGGLLGGLKVLDLSAFVAGPLGAQVLADLGADVIKIEPPEGEAMRAAAYAVAACQRGKRSLTINLGRPESRPIVERLIDWADVVLHNFRVGVAERLGVDEATVAARNPHAVYCHASAFGPTGPRARYPGNDALMQAVTGFERAVGGTGNDPLAATWIPIDMSGGWVAAAGVLAGLYARAEHGSGQQVATSLLGAGMLLQSGAYLRDGEVVSGPQLDALQTGYGPGYRIYEAGDGGWFALVVPDPDGWARLRSLPEASLLPARYVPLRTGDDATDGEVVEAEKVLEAAFLGASAAEWIGRLRALDLLVEPIGDVSRDGFRQGILDDPVNQRLGRTVAYDALDWGHFEQIGRLVRCGPDAEVATPLMLPAIGQHTVEVLLELGFTQPEIDTLLATEVVGGA